MEIIGGGLFHIITLGEDGNNFVLPYSSIDKLDNPLLLRYQRNNNRGKENILPSGEDRQLLGYRHFYRSSTFLLICHYHALPPPILEGIKFDRRFLSLPEGAAPIES